MNTCRNCSRPTEFEEMCYSCQFTEAKAAYEHLYFKGMCTLDELKEAIHLYVTSQIESVWDVI